MAVTALLTAEVFAGLPKTAGKQELVRGVISEMPPPSNRHTSIALEIYSALREYLRGNPIGRAYAEAGFALAHDTVVQPDAAFLTSARIERQAGSWAKGAPELAVEVVSPSNTAAGMQRRIALLFEHGSKEVWVVYPDQMQVHAYTAPTQVRIHTSAEIITTELLPGFELPVSRIFDV